MMGEFFDDLGQWEQGTVGADEVTAAHPAAAELLEMHSLLTMLTTEREYGGGPGWDQVVERLDDRVPLEPEARRLPFGRVIAALLAGVVVGPATAAAAGVDVLGHRSQGVAHVQAAATRNGAAPAPPPHLQSPPPAPSSPESDAPFRAASIGRDNVPGVVDTSLPPTHGEGGGERGGESPPAVPVAASTAASQPRPDVASAGASPVPQPPAPEPAPGKGVAEPDAAAPASPEPAPGEPPGRGGETVEPPAGGGEPDERSGRERGRRKGQVASAAGGEGRGNGAHEKSDKPDHNRGGHGGAPNPAPAEQP